MDGTGKAAGKDNKKAMKVMTQCTLTKGIIIHLYLKGNKIFALSLFRRIRGQWELYSFVVTQTSSDCYYYSQCSDTWDLERCTRKLDNDLCFKRKVANNCAKTCGICAPKKTTTQEVDM